MSKGQELDFVMKELERSLTIDGSGEDCLNPEVADALKNMADTGSLQELLLATYATLCDYKELMRAAAEADYAARGALMWAGCNWGEPRSLLCSVEELVKKYDKKSQPNWDEKVWSKLSGGE